MNNQSEEKRIGLLYMSHVIKMIDIISLSRFSNIYSYINKVVIRLDLYPEWPHRQCIGLTFRRLHVSGSLTAASLVICSPHCTVQYVELSGYCPLQGGGCDQSIGSTSCSDHNQLRKMAGCGRLQLGAPHWATSVNYCEKLLIEPTFCGSRFSTGRLLAIEDFTFTF